MKGIILVLIWAVFSAVTSFSTVARAQTATGGGEVKVLELEATQRKSKGQLDACEIRYIVAFQDNIYRKGAVSFLRGAVSLMGMVSEADKPPGILLKATAFDLVGDKPVFTPLELAYLSAGGTSYAGKQTGTFTCEDGGQCVAYNFFDHPDLAIALGSGFEINFTRAGGRSDVAVPITIGGPFRQVSVDYNQCTLELMQALEKKFQ